jgi:hypothetical protein
MGDTSTPPTRPTICEVQAFQQYYRSELRLRVFQCEKDHNVHDVVHRFKECMCAHFASVCSYAF